MLCSLPFLLALAPAALAAADADDAERDRIRAEMNVLAGRHQWNGVEQLYGQLLTLAARGVAIDPATHMLGVQAARTDGRMNDVLDRLERAIAAGDRTAAGHRMTLLAEYGRVQIELAARPAGEWSFEQVPTPFDPTARAAIEHADQELHERKRFAGLLPAGTYRLGEQRVRVPAGENETIIVIDGQTAESRRPPKAGPPEKPPALQDDARPGPYFGESSFHVRVGAGLGVLTAPPPGVVAPPAGVGLTPVLGGGRTWRRGEFVLTGLVAARAFFASAGDGGQELYLGTAGVMAGWDLGDIRLEVGPLYGIGAGRSTGVAPSADPIACMAGACASEQTRGTTYGPGAELGLGIPLFEAGSGVGSLEVHAGAIADGIRTTPWMTLAIGVSPATPP